MNLDSILNVIFFVVGLGIGLLQLYLAQHQFEAQQREKMDELRRILTDIQQRIAVLEETTSDRVFGVQDKLIGLISDAQAVTEFTEGASKEIRKLVEAEFSASGVHDSIQRTKHLEQQLAAILERSAVSLVEHTSGGQIPPLTIREQQVLNLVLTGRSNSEISENLALSQGTVKMIFVSLLNKFGVSSRTQLLVACARNGYSVLPEADGAAPSS